MVQSRKKRPSQIDEHVLIPAICQAIRELSKTKTNLRRNKNRKNAVNTCKRKKSTTNRGTTGNNRVRKVVKKSGPGKISQKVKKVHENLIKNSATQNKTNKLKRECLKNLKDTICQALSKGYVEVSPNGTFQLKLSETSIQDNSETTPEPGVHSRTELNSTSKNEEEIIMKNIPPQHKKKSFSLDGIRARSVISHHDDDDDDDDEHSVTTYNSNYSSFADSCYGNCSSISERSVCQVKKLPKRTLPNNYTNENFKLKKCNDNIQSFVGNDRISKDQKSSLESKMHYYEICKQNMELGKQWTRYLSTSSLDKNYNRVIRLRRNESILAKVVPLFGERNIKNSSNIR